MKSYTIVKHTATHADALAAIGAADVLRHLEPRILEFEDRFEVRLRRDLIRSDIETVDPGFSYLLQRGKAAPNLPPERITRVRVAAEEGEQTTAGTGAREDRMYLILSKMKAQGGPNRVVSRFGALPPEEWTTNVWESLHGARDFGCSSPLVQLFNPQSARGYALLKPNCTDRSDKTKDAWGVSFLEWLRFRGYFEGSAGWFTGGDLRFLCPIPANVPYDELAPAASAFRNLRLGGSAAKIDCRAVLGMARLLIEGAKTYRRPAQAVRGVWVTHYKNMGQAHMVIATEQLALPDWFELRSGQQARRWLQTLEEHDTVLRRLTDTHSDEYALLKQYRRTFQLRRDESIREFVTFLMEYGILLFKRRAQDHWSLPQFSVSGVCGILSHNPTLRRMLQNSGFQAVAGSIRGATVGAQAARYRGRLEHREIRYGLLGEIRRADGLGRERLRALVGGFVSEFNREATRRRAGGFRAMRIDDSEWEAFRSLTEELPLEAPVGALLCGLATCLPRAAESVEAAAGAAGEERGVEA